MKFRYIVFSSIYLVLKIIECWPDYYLYTEKDPDGLELKGKSLYEYVCFALLFSKHLAMAISINGHVLYIINDHIDQHLIFQKIQFSSYMDFNAAALIRIQ